MQTVPSGGSARLARSVPSVFWSYANTTATDAALAAATASANCGPLPLAYVTTSPLVAASVCIPVSGGITFAFHPASGMCPLPLPLYV